MKDLILEDNDIKIEDGDFIIGDSKDQHIEAIFNSHKGEFKERPEIGFGANNYLKTNISPFEFKRNLKVELERDGFKDIEISIDKDTKRMNINVN